MQTSQQERLEGALVVGAGPAGLMAADRLAQAGAQVILCEAMPSPARKFLLAGLSGLNITHDEPLSDLLKRYRPSHRNLLLAIEKFPPKTVRNFCAALGQETFVGSSGRVFPKSMKAAPLLRAWLNRLKSAGVALRSRWRLIDWSGDAFIFSTPDGQKVIKPQACVLALGGASWPRLGANGAWTSLLQAHGFEIAPLTASNCGLRISWPQEFLEKFDGAPIKNIRAIAGQSRADGDLTVTRGGLEGGPIYALSHELRALALEERPVVTLDLKPAIAQSHLAARLAQGRTGDSLANILRKRHLSPVQAAILRLSVGGPLPRQPALLAARIKNAGIKFEGFEGLERAISTAGGVTFDQLDVGFMAKNAPGVFFAGEMLDWDAPTGGYLLQACLATGAGAGDQAADWLHNGRRNCATKI